MAGRRKLEKFAAISNYENVLENFDTAEKTLYKTADETIDIAGKWNENFFHNDQPIVIELACGYGEYVVSLAQQNPHKNYIGVDVKGNRIFQGATTGIQKNLKNLGFLRTRIEILDSFFAPNEVDEIWITFPDPFLKTSKQNRRLTAPYFLDLYKKIIKPNGNLFLKTDSEELFDFSMEVLQKESESIKIIYSTDDIYRTEELYLPELAIKTRYENIHSALGKSIKFIHFTFEVED